MGLPKVPYFRETNPVIAVQSSARTDLSACRLATRTDHDTMPDFPADKEYRTDTHSTAGYETQAVNGMAE